MLLGYKLEYKLSILELYHQFVHLSVVTNAREYRKIFMKEVVKTIAHRKQIRISGAAKKTPAGETAEPTEPLQMNEDEVEIEPSDSTSLCAHCGCESTELEEDSWILCDEYV